SDREVEAFGQALPTFYEWADQLLGELIEAAGDDTTVMVISDHGFFTGAMRPESDPADFASGAAQWHRLFGIVVGDGPGIGRAEVTGASIFDVAPTVLAQLGLPVPDDMDGSVIEELLPSAARGGPPPGQLASYEPLPRSRPEAIRFSAEDDEDRLRELVALGYISPDTLEERTGGGGDGGDAGTRRPPPPGQTAAGGSPLGASAGGDEGVVTEAYNLGRIAQREGRLDDAERQYRLALSRVPSFGLAYASLAQVEALRGDHGAAFEWLVQGLTRGQQLPQSAITGLVEEANEAGRLAEAEPVLERVRPKFQAKNGYHAAWGLLREHQGNPQQALTHYDQALAIEPLDQLAIEQKMTILRGLGREAEAKAVLTGSFEYARGSVTTMNQLAVAALRQGWSREAETLLREVLESDPGNPGVLANLAASLARQRRMKEASDVMARAVERDPTNAGNHFNLGAMLAEQGRIAEALTSFEKALDLGLRYPRVYVAAAKMHFRLGDRAASRRALEQALAIAPNDPEARQLLNALDQAGS
ncbi:MAG TPA: tetratricopeptide repeat protein, partial [Thermoanaerobaculia bacterium]|nr:tetratricopeptide repeat protein [Thermoanaerobaculia bacterium]